MKTAEQRVNDRVKKLFQCRNVSELARRTGYKQQTLSYWKHHPLAIKAIDLEKLEDKLT